MNEDKLKIICVLKSGGPDYTRKYVEALKAGLDRVLWHRDDWEMVCFTDKCEPIKGVEMVPLECGYEGWWSKIEIFRYTGPCLYIDLDTVLIDNIEKLVDHILYNMGNDDFLMLEPFNLTPQSNDGKWASGLMAWNGDWSQIFHDFIPSADINQYKWDQKYITAKLDELDAHVDSIQNHLKGVYSYKMHVKATLPPDATIVCFHGRPRPHNATWIGWVKRHWGV